MVCSKETLKCVSGQTDREGGHSCVILDLKEFVLSMLNGHFEGVLASDWLALPFCNGRVLPLSDIIQLGVDVHHKLVFFLLAQG